MPTTLDRLKEMSDLLRQLLFMEDDALQAVLTEGFGDSPPEWVDRLPKELWANSLLDDIKNSSELLDERLTSPGALRTVRARVNVSNVTFRHVTPEEREQLRREQDE